MLTFVLLAAGLVALVLGAELLVRGASRLALSLGISPLVVGLTIVAVGTSSPEVAVSVGAAVGGQTDIAVGNVVGSNIFNVLLILGLSALIIPLAVNAQIVRQEVPIMIGASLLLLTFGLDGRVGRVEAGTLLALLVAYVGFLIVQSRREQQAGADAAAATGAMPVDKPATRNVPLQLLWICAGLGLLVLGSNLLVDASIALASAIGVSDVVIGLTIVAAGTSMPEVATSIMAALRGERDIAIGNVVGSNIFNILGCLGLAGVVSSAGLPLAPSLLNFDLWVMLAVAFACLPVFLTGRTIARWEGAIFVFYYVAYVAYLILAAQQHDALEAFSGVMLGFVVPITVITLVVAVSRPAARPE
ncbi:calcium/sodium antiporter [Luteimonas sp. RD2P54]|uniref:Calcium/sodium antiporter n=1 Tax=Luteimonas endophytica TaxID=3042023 RepID=A0ABT6JAI6_9GAMM|nr:calcium/sodium antiporter [Luteimonas endophytica]MDH5823595.1 calcium/sodium antiporter [Luteimonas endophytica]